MDPTRRDMIALRWTRSLTNDGPRPRVTVRAAVVLIVVSWLLLGVGCRGPEYCTVRERPRIAVPMSLRQLPGKGLQPSERTLQLLSRYDLERKLSSPPEELLEAAEQGVATELTADRVYALAELAFLGARQVESRDEQRALDLYGEAVAHAFSYLFDPQLDATRNPYDPQYRGASDIYNGALESALRLAQDQGVLRPGTTYTIETTHCKIDIAVQLKGSRFHNEDFDRFEFVSDYQVRALNNRYIHYGLGVPLIGIRKSHPFEDPKERFYPPNLSIPVTALLRFEESELVAVRHATQGDAARHVRAVLELHDPLESSETIIANRLVPLQSDVSTPLAYFLNQPEFDSSRLSTLGLLNPGGLEEMTGLYLLEPFRPGKIPVIMVHGLWSSPVTWMEMFNDLRSDPQIRKDYQFWFYLYPTGKPFWFSAAQMREDLASARAEFDPQRLQPELDQMILVGHSMGGLVAKLQAVESRGDFWELISTVPIQEVEAPEPVRATLARTLYFRPNPSVRRIITIGTPHRGSSLSNSLTQWAGRKLIRLPMQVMSGREKLLRDNPDTMQPTNLLAIETSIDSLSPGSDFLQRLSQRSPAPWVRHHNIVGHLAEPSFLQRLLVGPGDGVVPLPSASRDDVASQKTIDAEHSQIQSHPGTIAEVRRILEDHVRTLRRPRPLHWDESPAAYQTPVGHAIH